MSHTLIGSGFLLFIASRGISLKPGYILPQGVEELVLDDSPVLCLAAGADDWAGLLHAVDATDFVEAGQQCGGRLGSDGEVTYTTLPQLVQKVQPAHNGWEVYIIAGGVRDTRGGGMEGLG